MTPSFRIRARAICVLFALQLILAGSTRANNVSISNVIMTGQDQGGDFILVQFDLSWENSWRIVSGDETYDAVWVFIKYRLSPAAPWQHATLNTSGHTAPAGSEIVAPPDGKGVFVQRDGAGTGSVNFTGVQIRWNYGVDGLADDVENVDVEVLAIEMVYIPEGSFAAGSGGTGPEFTLTTIDTADATVVPSGLGEFEGQAGGHPTGQVPPNNASWPNGFSPFYIMKYEVSQGEYAEFLSLLTFTQQGNLFPVGATGSNRFTIASTPPGFTATVPDRACGFLSWAFGIAYSDWAGLRPMTEMEFEKAARGRALRVPDEYAWGTTNLHTEDYAITDDGLSNSTLNAGSATGNALYDETVGALGGPVRVGIFAASTGSPTREEAGASFYGVMELSGNLNDRVVSITQVDFTPVHGDGALTEAGFADVSTWPAGGAFKGGSWGGPAEGLRTSDRSGAIAINPSDAWAFFGFRAVRSAP